MGFEMLDRLTPSVDKEKVVISRYWSKPEITVTVNRDKITVMTDLDAFVEGLIAELEVPKQEPAKMSSLAKFLLGDSVTMRPPEKLDGYIRAAAQKAIERIKEATAQVM